MIKKLTSRETTVVAGGQCEYFCSFSMMINDNGYLVSTNKTNTRSYFGDDYWQAESDCFLSFCPEDSSCYLSYIGSDFERCSDMFCDDLYCYYFIYSAEQLIF